MGEVKKKFVLKGLSCANCARKMEDRIGNLDQVLSASINFADSILSVELLPHNGLEEVIKDIKGIINDIESDVEVIDHHDHTEAESDEDTRFFTKDKLLLLFGILLFAIAIFAHLQPILMRIFYLAAYLIIGKKVLKKAAKNIIKGQVFDENFLMSIASIGAIAIGEYPEAVAVMLFYRVGNEFQDAAVNRSRASIKLLMNIKPDKANLLINGEILIVNPKEVKIGDQIIVRPGERVPLDGKVSDGWSQLDTSALTGESVPRRVAPGDEVLSGAINGSGAITMEVSKIFADSTVSKILDLVQNATSKKAATEQFITRFAKIYTPIVVAAAAGLAVLPPLFIHGAEFSDWLYRALIFLVISCPCALVISIPLSFFGGIGGASRRGILVKGGNTLEALHAVDTVVFDKTGTITEGEFVVSQINPVSEFSKEDLLEIAAHAEFHSSHPIARSIIYAYGKEVSQGTIKDYQEMSGRGVKAEISGRSVLAGSSSLLKEENVSFSDEQNSGTVVHLAVDGHYAGNIEIADTLKADSAIAMKKLKALGIKRLVILSGDRKTAVAKAAEAAGIDEYYYELLPHQKVEKLEEIMKEQGKGKVAFVGDGLNDAPVLARADVGIAMGGIGSDTAIEAADVVLMTDEPTKMAEAIKIARKTRTIVLQNIIIAMGIKLLVLGMGAFGIATMWEAVFADVGAALLAVFNSMRVLKFKG